MNKGKLPVFIFSGKSPISASGGGYSTYAYNLARVLTKLGHKVYILALGEKDTKEKIKVGTLLIFRTKIPFLNVNVYALPGLPLYGIVLAKGVRKIVQEEGYNKFIVWGIGPWGFAATLVKLLFGEKVIHVNNYFTTVRHEWWGGVKALRIKDYGIRLKLKYLAIYLTVAQYLSVLERIVLKSADIIITNYRSTEEILKEEFAVKQNKFHRAHFYVQLYKRSVQKAVEGNEIKLPKKFLLFFSRQDPRKGVNYLLHAMKILIEMGYKIPLLIAGGGDMLPYNIKLTKKLKIEKYVKFLGFVNNPKLLMEKCSVFVFPSIEEGAGALTINEAMEMSLPVVSTACDGIIEDIEDGKSGLLVPKENSDAMAIAIERILNSSDLAKKLGKNAKKYYDRNFSYQKMEKDIKKLMSSLID
ncbi:MAG: glycosyltransferase family 4 protein [Candidatus Woesebacteria bacterium]|nr:glycosyltransferase family 4 protein [Candidatus Woesebacteria bacterium]